MKLSIVFGFIGYMIPVITSVASSRVLELTDRFVDISEEGQWLVKFYAPWCAHCKRLEPIWAHVAQALNTSPIKVAKVDCTRFSSVATHFQIRAFPTILFLKGPLRHEYTGERSKEDLVNYALRMSRPAVQQVTKANTVDYLKDTNSIFFAHVGKQSGLLWKLFVYYAERYQPHGSFYAMSHDIAKRDIQSVTENCLFVYKDNKPHFFTVHDVTETELNETLDKWINAERFGTFPKVTRSNINNMMDTGKYLVLTVVEENKLNEITQGEQEFKDMIESIIRKRKDELHGRFQFGWIGSPDIANSITASILPVPHLIVLNSTTRHHHIPEDDPLKLTVEAVTIFLDQVENQLAPTYGGNTFLMRLYRSLFEAKTSLVEMWRGNPVLTTLVFGLPLGFLSLICYSIFCADMLDAEEEESAQDDDQHEKKE